MNKLFYVYVHRRATDNSIFYVGKGFGYRADSKSSRNQHWHNIVKKNGYIVEIVLQDLTESQAFSLEVELIKFYGKNNLCNLTDGGDGTSGFVQSESTKQKLRELSIKQFSCPLMLEAHKVREKKKWSNPEMRLKMSEIIKEVSKNPELKQRISNGIKAVWQREGFREKMSIMRIEHYSTPEMKLKLSNGQKKRFDNPIFLKEHQERQKKLSKAVFCETNGKTYQSQSEAALDLGINQGGISQVVRGECKTYKGYVFRSAD